MKPMYGALIGTVLFFSHGPAFSQTDYEAESAALGGTANVSTEHAGFSGSGYVQGYDAGDIGASTSFTVAASAAGYYDVTLRYGNGYDASSISVYVNSIKQVVSALPSTGSWTTWSTKTETFLLKSGSNAIAYTFDTGDGARINLDKITVAPTAATKPDLSVSDIQWTPPTPLEGDTIRFSATVNNTGNGPSPSVSHKVSFRVDNAEVSVSSPNAMPIQANGSATITAAAVWSSSHGTYTVSAVVDPDNTIAEFNENNNTKSKPLTIGQKPGADLVVQAINWTPANPSAGNAVGFSVVVKNQGLDASPASGVAVRVAINGSQTLNGSLTNAIAAGGSATVSITGTWTAANGSCAILATVDPQNVIAESFEGNNTMTRNLYVGRGAQVPWIEYEAEDGTCAGGALVIGPSRELGTPAGEASGRKAVMLDQTDKSVEWTALSAANSIVIRVCIPDAPAGGGIEAPLSLYINGTHKADIIISSAHNWLYGDDANQTDVPGPGARKIYSEASMLFKGFSIAAGDKVMLRKDATDNAAYYAVDLIDLEQAGAPVPMPSGYISITDATQTWAAAKPDDGIADDNAINQCIAAVQAGKFSGVYIPEGVFQQDQKIMVTHAKIQGAGMWYSKLYCPNKTEDAGWGQTGFNINGDSCEFRDFSLWGWGGVRAQGGKAWVNSAHRNTVIERMWVEDVQCGYWVGGNQESTNLLVRDCRFRNTGADGINLCNGSLNCVIENCTARSTGDDGFAIWSATDLWPHPCTDNVIRNCTVQLPWRAACFAIYGGKGNRIENCVGADALTYPGLTVSSEFNPYPFESATVDGVTLYRCGGHYFKGYPWEGDFGAIWLRADLNPTNGITIRNVDVIDPSYQGILVQGGGAFTNTLLENITISNPTTVAIQIKSDISGSATFRNVNMISNQYSVPRLLNQSTKFTLTEEAVSVTSNRLPVNGLAVKISCSGSRVIIDFTVPALSGNAGAPVNIGVFLANGKRAAMFRETFTAGNHRVSLDRKSAFKASGFYLVAVENAGKKQLFPVVLK
jgi:hypothetical protein